MSSADHPLLPVEESIARQFFAMLTGDELAQALVFANATTTQGPSRFRFLVQDELRRRQQKRTQPVVEDDDDKIVPLRRFRIEE